MLWALKCRLPPHQDSGCHAGLMDGTARLSKTATCVYYSDECGPTRFWLVSKCQMVTTCAPQKADVKAGRGRGARSETTQGQRSHWPHSGPRVAPWPWARALKDEEGDTATRTPKRPKPLWTVPCDQLHLGEPTGCAILPLPSLLRCPRAPSSPLEATSSDTNGAEQFPHLCLNNDSRTLRPDAGPHYQSL